MAELDNVIEWINQWLCALNYLKYANAGDEDILSINEQQDNFDQAYREVCELYANRPQGVDKHIDIELPERPIAGPMDKHLHEGW